MSKQPALEKKRVRSVGSGSGSKVDGKNSKLSRQGTKQNLHDADRVEKKKTEDRQGVPRSNIKGGDLHKSVIEKKTNEKDTSVQKSEMNEQEMRRKNIVSEPFQTSETIVSGVQSETCVAQKKGGEQTMQDLKSEKKDCPVVQIERGPSVQSDGYVQIWRDATDVLLQEEANARPGRRSSFDPSVYGRSKDIGVADRRCSLETRKNSLVEKKRLSFEPEGRRNSSEASCKSRIPRRFSSIEPRPSPIGSENVRQIRPLLVPPRQMSKKSYQLSDGDYTDSDEEVFLPSSEKSAPLKGRADGKSMEKNSEFKKFHNGDKKSKFDEVDKKSRLVFGPQKREIERAMRRSSSYDTIISKKKKELTDSVQSPIQRAQSTGSIERGQRKGKDRSERRLQDLDGKLSSNPSKTYKVSGSRCSLDGNGKIFLYLHVSKQSIMNHFFSHTCHIHRVIHTDCPELPVCNPHSNALCLLHII